MSHFRHWLLVSLCFPISGCQIPLFSNGISSFWPRKGSEISNQTDESSREAIQQVASPPDRQQQLRDLLMKGNLELTSGRFRDAGLYFEQALQLDPNNFQAHHMLARIGDQTQEYEAAERHYLAALSVNPADPNLLSDMGFSYMMQGEFVYANTYLQKALSYQQDHVMARRNLAAAAAYQGDHGTALAWLRQLGTEEQAQTTLRELASNPPPRLHRKNDLRQPLPSEATPAAQELAARLQEAKKQSSYDNWKREMARWSQDSRDQQNRSLRSTAGPAGLLRQSPMGQGIADEDLQGAMRAIDEGYNRHSARSNQTASTPALNHSPYLQDLPAPPVSEHWQSQGQQAMNPAPAGGAGRWQQMQSPPLAYQQPSIQTQPALQVPRQTPPPYSPGSGFQNGQWAAPDSASTPQFAQPQAQFAQPQAQFAQPQAQFAQPQAQFAQPQAQFAQPQFSVPATNSAGGFGNGPQTLPGLNPIQSRQRMELLPPPADFRQSGSTRQQPGTRPSVSGRTGPGSPTLSDGPWNPQQNSAAGDAAVRLPANAGISTPVPVQNAGVVPDGTRRAVALGMSAGPGSLFPMGASPAIRGPSAAQIHRTQQLPNRPDPHQVFSGTVPVPEVRTAPGGVDPRFLNSQQSVRTPDQAIAPQTYPQATRTGAGFTNAAAGPNSQWTPGQVYLPPNGGAGSLNSNWQSLQSTSPTWNHATSQPVNPQQQWSRPSPTAEHWRDGSFVSPTTRARFGQPVSVDRSQPATTSPQPAGTMPAPAGQATAPRSIQNQF